MKTILTFLLTCWISGQALAETAWLTSVPQALAQAKRENKAVLLDFTGSDWCGWCIKLKEETLSKQEFLDYAAKSLVLVELDFPRRHPQADELKQANQLLSSKFGVSGFPTLVVLKSDGSVLWKQPGYLPGGPAALIAELNKVLPKPAVKATEVNFGTIGFAHATAAAKTAGDEPKLQGIFYSSHPSVMLDGKTLAEGDAVNGMRVVRIARDKVTVEWKGATKDLTMN